MNTGTILFFSILAVVLIAGILFFWFYRREKKLLERIHFMVEEAKRGRMGYREISEGRLSSLENDLKRFLDDSLLSRENQERQKKIIQGLISDIAHQTLTPVSNLKLYGELLQEKIIAPDFVREGDGEEIVDTLLEQAEKLDFLIQSLVKLSKMESGIIEVHPGKGSVRGMLEKLCGEYQLKAAQKGQKLNIQLPGKREETACFDEKWTEEALGNLIDNAIKYTPKGGSIEVYAERFPTFLCIHVKDSGRGIAEAEINRIFTRFYRGKDVLELPGVGIGLYLSREIIRAQKGYIKVSSKIGEGSVFSVFLPGEISQK